MNNYRSKRLLFLCLFQWWGLPYVWLWQLVLWSALHRCGCATDEDPGGSSELQDMAAGGLYRTDRKPAQVHLRQPWQWLPCCSQLLPRASHFTSGQVTLIMNWRCGWMLSVLSMTECMWVCVYVRTRVCVCVCANVRCEWVNECVHTHLCQRKSGRGCERERERERVWS